MSSRSRRGYTLVEIMVVVIIFSTLSAVILANFKGSSRNQRLVAAADEMASRIRQAQGLAYGNVSQEICDDDFNVCGSGSACDATYPANCFATWGFYYGVKFDTDGGKDKYAIGVDLGPDQYAQKQTVPGSLVTLPKDIIIDSVSPIAVPPASYDLRYVYNSANASPFVFCSTGCITTVVLKDTVTSATKTIKIVKQTGIVTVE
jgi:prepilin-type N-terminal cleavage/methylation domain-containing protein